MFVVRETPQNGRWIAPIHDAYTCSAVRAPKPRGKARRHACCVARGDVGRKRRVERDRELIDRERIVRDERNYLRRSVDARIRAARHGDFDRPGEQSRERAFELSRDRSQCRLKLKAAEVRAVVFDDDTIRRVGNLGGRLARNVALFVEIEQVCPHGHVRAVGSDFRTQGMEILSASLPGAGACAGNARSTSRFRPPTSYERTSSRRPRYPRRSSHSSRSPRIARDRCPRNPNTA